ncbi:MFS transporter [Paenalcaligenes sp. Me131]|uniref:MFS transporter n=1 Tax=Paenalcaligenes sp. Me131 TaxID=3392636 RepID=UPI003D29EE27
MLSENSAVPYRYRWLTLLAVASALLLIVVDITVLYTALPSLSAALHTTTSEKLWIVNAYSLVVAGLLLGMGSLGDHIGHRRMFMSGLTVFGLASLWAAFSPSSLILIIARAALGLGAAMMMPATLAIIRDVFTDEKERSLAIGVWSSIAAGGAAMGPVVGGMLLEYFWWGSVFLINVPIVVLTLVVSLWVVPKHQPEPTHKKWDGCSSLLVMVGLIAAVSALKEAALPNTSWAYFWGSVVMAFVFLGWFTHRQLHGPYPLLSFAIFKNPLFSAGVITAFLSTVTLSGVEFAFTQQLQLVLEHSPFNAALVLLPLPISSLLAGPLSGYVMRYLPYQRLLVVAVLLSLVGMTCFAVLHDMGTWPRAASLILLGCGLSAAMTTASYAVLEQAPANQVGMVGSLEEISYELGGAMGVAVMGSVMSAVYSAYMLATANSMNLPSAVDSLDEVRYLVGSMPAESAQPLLHAALQAFDNAFNVVSWSAVGIMAAALLMVWGLVRQSEKKHPASS